MSTIGSDEALTERIGRYLAAQMGRAPRIGRIKRFPVGFSWLTFLVPVDDRELILRLGPDDGLFAPYSAGPQVMAMQSLQGSGVPLPRAFWHSDDPAILGAPFLFSDKAEGEAVVPWVAPTEPPLEEGLRIRLANQFIDCLAALHRADWRGQPIAAMAGDVDEDNAALRSVQTWEALIRRWQMRPYPLADWGLRWLKSHCPRAPRVTIVHGDYRTGNFLQQDGAITAILDWELVHLGDPHEDLAWASMPMYKGGTPYAAGRHHGGHGLGALLPGLLAAEAGGHAHGGGALLRGRALQRPAHAGDGQPDRHLFAADGEDDRSRGGQGMNNSFPRLIDGLCATLRTEVLSRLDDEFARGQVFGVINVLNTFKVRADWSAGFLLQQIAAQQRALDALRPLVGVPLPTAPLPAAAPAAELLARRDEGNRALQSVMQWLDGEAGAALDAERRARIEALLLQAMRAEVDLELKHSPRPLFAEMSSGREG